MAFVSRVYPYNTHSPTIVEWLTFWVASASGIANADIFPKVCGEPRYIPHQSPCTVYDAMDQDPDSALALYLL